MNSSIARRQALRCVAAAALAASSFASMTAHADTPAVLRVSAIPDEAPTELQRKFKPLGEYLSKATGMKVVFTPVSDYAAVVESLATNKLEMAEDKYGDPVYLAQSQWWLGRAERDYPKITFHTTKERH